jgi:hypothetical protein
MQTVTFRAPQGSRANIQRRFFACLLAAMVVGLCSHSARAAFEDDSASCGSSDWTGTDGAAATDSGHSVDFTVDCHVDDKGGPDLSNLSVAGHAEAADAHCSELLLMLDGSGGSSGGDSTGGGTGGTGGGSSSSSSPSFGITPTSVLLPEPGAISLIALGGLGLLARCRRNAKHAS